jgi:hypothetical protein
MQEAKDILMETVVVNWSEEERRTIEEVMKKMDPEDFWNLLGVLHRKGKGIEDRLLNDPMDHMEELALIEIYAKKLLSLAIHCCGEAAKIQAGMCIIGKNLTSDAQEPTYYILIPVTPVSLLLEISGIFFHATKMLYLGMASVLKEIDPSKGEQAIKIANMIK